MDVPPVATGRSHEVPKASSAVKEAPAPAATNPATTPERQVKPAATVAPAADAVDAPPSPIAANNGDRPTTAADSIAALRAMDALGDAAAATTCVPSPGGGAAPGAAATAQAGASTSLLASASGMSHNHPTATTFASLSGAGTSADERALLQLLQEELRRLSASAATTANAAELAQRAEQRSFVELRIAAEQLEAATRQRARVVAELTDERQRVAALTAKLTVAEAEATRVRDQHAALAFTTSSERRTLYEKYDASVTRVAALEQRIVELEERNVAAATRASEELKSQKEEAREHATTSAHVQHKVKAALEEIEALRAEKLQEQRKAMELDYDRVRAIAAATGERESLRAELERERRAHVDDVASLKRDLAATQIRADAASSSGSDTLRRDAETIAHLRNDLAALTLRAESAVNAAAAREQALLAQVTSLTMQVTVATDEAQSLRDGRYEDGRALRQQAIEAGTHRDAARRRVVELESDLLEAQAKTRAAHLDGETRLEQLRAEHATALRRAAAADDESRQRIASLQAEIAAERAEVERQAGIVQRLTAEAAATTASHERQLAGLREEIRGYRGAVAQLDRHIQDNVPVRLLHDEMAQLKEQNEALQAQLRKANTSLSTLRVEATAMEGMRVSSLQGLVKDYQRRIAHLEKEQRFGRPLIKDLAAAARRHGSLDVVLERDVELFTRQFVVAAAAGGAADDHAHAGAAKPLLLA